MAHKLFWRRDKEEACGACQELPSGLPCYDCTFGLQNPPPKYASVKNPPDQPCPNLPVEDGLTFDVASLAQGVSRLGVAVAMAIDPSQDAVEVSSHYLVARIRHLSEQRSSTGGSGYLGLHRNVSAPSLQHLDNLVLPEPSDLPLEEPFQSSVEEAPLATEEELPSSTEEEPSTPPEEEAEELPLLSDEEPHVLLAALTTNTPAPESDLDMERESSPLPCQLLIPE